MKRSLKLLTPLLAFVLAGAIAWLTGSAAEKAATSANDTHYLNEPNAGQVDLLESNTALDVLEYEFLNYIPEPQQPHDADVMNALLNVDDRYGFPQCGVLPADISYAMAWADEAPQEMFSWLVNQNESAYSRCLPPASTLFGTWADKDMSAALTAVNKISNPHVRAQAMISTVEILCLSDPTRARELMELNLQLFSSDEPSPNFGYNSGSNIAMCDILLLLPPGKERTQLLASLLNEMVGSILNDEATIKARAVWVDASDSQRNEWVDAGFGNSGYSDYRQEEFSSFEGLNDMVMHRAESSGDLEYAEKYISSRGPAWAKRDLAGALEWTQAHLKGLNRVEYSEGLFKHAASEDIVAAVSVWKTLTNNSLKARAKHEIEWGAPPDKRDEARNALEASR